MEIAIIVLGLICIGQMVDRYLFTKSMILQLDDAIKAIKSKDINEYMVAKQQEKTKPLDQVESEEVLIEDASDEEFDKHIKIS